MVKRQSPSPPNRDLGKLEKTCGLKAPQTRGGGIGPPMSTLCPYACIFAHASFKTQIYRRICSQASRSKTLFSPKKSEKLTSRLQAAYKLPASSTFFQAKFSKLASTRLATTSNFQKKKGHQSSWTSDFAHQKMQEKADCIQEARCIDPNKKEPSQTIHDRPLEATCILWKEAVGKSCSMLLVLARVAQARTYTSQQSAGEAAMRVMLCFI